MWFSPHHSTVLFYIKLPTFWRNLPSACLGWNWKGTWQAQLKYSTIYMTVCCHNHQTTTKIQTKIIKCTIFIKIWHFYYYSMNLFLQGTNYLIIHIWVLYPRIYIRNINTLIVYDTNSCYAGNHMISINTSWVKCQVTKTLWYTNYH